MSWDISEHVFRNNIFVFGMNYGTKCSIMLNLGVLTYYGMIHSVIVSFVLRNRMFSIQVAEWVVPYTSCGMGGSVYKLRNGWFRNTLGGVQTYCGTAHSVTCIRIRIDVVEWVVPNKNSSKIPHSQIAFPRNLNYTTNLTIDNTCLKWL